VRSAARLVALLGAVVLGWWTLSRGPQDVVLEYELGAVPEAIRLEVDLRRGADVVRHAEFRLPGTGETIVRHAVRVPRGAYTLGWRLVTPGGAVAGERPLEIEEDGTIVLSLGG
jgi:hypothetical protein